VYLCVSVCICVPVWVCKKILLDFYFAKIPCCLRVLTVSYMVRWTFGTSIIYKYFWKLSFWLWYCSEMRWNKNVAIYLQDMWPTTVL